MKKFCITIPVYSENLNPIDTIGLTRLYDVIGEKNYDVYFVCPISLSLDNYRKIFKNTLECRFNDEWFKSLYTYTQLCLQYEFYDRFSEYEYMFMYQLDSYIFEDKIEEVCNLGYDYIGGPIFSKISGWNLIDEYGKYSPKVGNGGCGWRKISVFKEICDPSGEFRTTYNITDEFIKKIAFEDKYFSNDIENLYDLYKPSWQETLRYTWDSSVTEIWNYLGKNKYLPICAHGIYKYPLFWKNIIKEYSSNEIIEYSMSKVRKLMEGYKKAEEDSLKK